MKTQPATGETYPKSDLFNKAAMKQTLMDEASLKISILQDAVDLDMATDEERTQLTTLKKYRVLLSRGILST
ncbi:tail fiber assembly protein [Escherichia coli]|uniref:tail fiber assembly protein n=1 Tax=Escherichia coli TaxID=562 RepID=UPI0019821331|nr:tail fiber assembly protein [Escherichia coli]MBN4692996.1 tail fiber assembly protein [Escherichia coli]